MTKHRVVVWSWMRRPGGLVLRDWVAITLGRTVFAWRELTDDELEHELVHVRQWQQHGPLFPITYLRASLGARRAGRNWYHDNPFEVEARVAPAAPRSVEQERHALDEDVALDPRN